MFKKLNKLRPDPILGLAAKFIKDIRKDKINLTVGELYYNNKEQSLFDYNFIMKQLNKTSKDYLSNSSKYLPITGLPLFIEESEKFIFGNKKDRVGIQTLSGTGSLMIGNYLLSLLEQEIYINKISWPSHYKIFNNYKTYKDINDLEKIPKKSTILFQTCCYNPTGIDYSNSEWDKIIKIMIKNNHIAYFDSAYIGLSSGDPKIDSKPINEFEFNKIPLIVSISYAKNLGLYGQRIGCLFYNFYDKEKELIYLQYLKQFIRKSYSNPPRAGAEMALYLLSNPDLLNKWKLLLNNILVEQKFIREELLNNLGWDIINNNGLFFISPLNKEQIIKLREDYGIYLLENGRINISGLNKNNINKFIKCIREVI